MTDLAPQTPGSGAVPSAGPDAAPTATRSDGAAGDAGGAVALQIAVVEATARIVSGKQSSHLIQDPDIADGVADCFRTVYRAILDAVATEPGQPGTPAG